MKTTIILETLTNTAIANLNRDDLGNVKNAIVGGVERIRISSQCIKRHVRMAMINDGRIKVASERSKTLPQQVFDALVADGVSEKDAEKGVTTVFGKNLDKKQLKDNKYHLTAIAFISTAEKVAIIEAIKTGKYEKDSFTKILKEAKARYGELIALFGRMFADDPDMSVEAASSFKHSYTVDAVEAEKDFFTAVDDNEGVHGSAHLDINEFGSGTFYGCTHLDVDQLAVSLGLDRGSEELKEIVAVFLESVIKAFPQAKKNSNLAQNLPYFVSVRVVEGSAVTNDDAFIKPTDSAGAVDRIRENIKKTDDAYAGFAYDVKYAGDFHKDEGGKPADLIKGALAHV